MAMISEMQSEGFDFRGAVERLGGEDSYEFLVKRFLVTVEPDLEILRNLLNVDSSETNQQAVYKLHILKGSALTLGALFLAEVIHQVEKSWLTASDCERMELIGRFDSAIAEVLKTLKAVITKRDNSLS